MICAVRAAQVGLGRRGGVSHHGADGRDAERRKFQARPLRHDRERAAGILEWIGAIRLVAEAAEQRGQKVKKRLAIDPVAAETGRLIFKLFLAGDGTSGPLGVKNIAKWLNTRGHRTPQGAPFYTGRVYDNRNRRPGIGASRSHFRHPGGPHSRRKTIG